MPISLRANQIEIPDDDPFKNDLLSRQNPANQLTSLVKNIESPAVIAIDGAWGSGKTTFLNLWKQSLLNENLPIVEFNAWENDNSANAILSLTSELTTQFQDYDPKFGVGKILTENTIKIFQQAAIESVKMATSGVLDISKLMNGESIFAEYKKHKDHFIDFKKQLEELARNYQCVKEFPLVIVIDELDRCRPTFAIEILETAKHLFSTCNVVFVLALNRYELSHSIASIYGDRFDSVGYLERFIDVVFRLPPADRKQFLLSQSSKQFRNLYRQDNEFFNAISFFFTIYASPEFNLRTASHYLCRLDYILASIGYDSDRLLVKSLVVALIARSIDFESYLRFNDGEISDEEFGNSIFDRIGTRNIRQTTAGAYIEAVLISVQHERESNRVNNTDADVSLASDLYRNIRTIANSSESTAAEKEHADLVIKIVEWDTNPQYPPHRFNLGKTYLHSVELIEMLSPR